MSLAWPTVVQLVVFCLTLAGSVCRIDQEYSFLFHHCDLYLIFVFSLWCIDWVREPLCEPNFLCMFVLRITLGPRVKICRQLKCLNSHHVCFATDRSKAVVLLLFLFCVALWFLLLGVSCWVMPCSLALWSPRLGKRVFVYVLLVYLFVYFAGVKNPVLFLFLLVSGLAASFDCGTPWTFLLTF